MSSTPAEQVMEIGTLQVEQTDTDTWHTVTFSTAIQDAVVVMGPPSDNGSQPMTVTVRNVTETGFEFQIDEWDYLDGYHVPVDISWIAGSEGDHLLDDGTRMTFGTTDMTGSNLTRANDFTHVDLTGFEGDPLVFGQVVADADVDVPATYRFDAITDDGFDVALQVEEAEKATAGTAQDLGVSWVAIDPNTGEDTRLGVDTVSDRQSLIDSSAFRQAVFADMQSFNGADTSTLRYDITGRGDFMLEVQEEQSRDDEMSHTDEDVAWILADTGVYDLYDTPTPYVEIGNVSTSQSRPGVWHSVEFEAPIYDAVVVMGPASYNGPQGAMMRVRNVTETGFEYQIQEWAYDDGAHTVENISWIAGPEGTWYFEDGTVATFGEADFDSSATGHVDLDAFDETPMVFGQIEGDDPTLPTLVERIFDVETDGFDFNIRPDEASRKADEVDGWEGAQLNYMAIQTASEFSEAYGTAMVSANGSMTNTGLDVSDLNDAALFAEMQSQNGYDTADLRYDVIADKLHFRVVEEHSWDTETSHTYEDVAALAFLETGLVEIYDDYVAIL